MKKSLAVYKSHYTRQFFIEDLQRFRGHGNEFIEFNYNKHKYMFKCKL